MVVGDLKTPEVKESDNLVFLSVERQKELGFGFTEYCPFNHYSRKNIGFLYAMREGADVIFDMDDDNLPSSLWSNPSFTCNMRVKSDNKFINIYKHFTNQNIWPRGLPLDEIDSGFTTMNSKPIALGVLQSMSDRAPDVDAIYRLTRGTDLFYFRQAPTICVPEGIWTPFNSQCSFWTKEAFSFLYLPATVRFRYTDILRGYLAQKLLWDRKLCVGFCNAYIAQDRNVHDLMVDFESELNLYLDIKKVVASIENITGGLESLYETLASAGLVDERELLAVSAWTKDVSKL